MPLRENPVFPGHEHSPHALIPFAYVNREGQGMGRDLRRLVLIICRALKYHLYAEAAADNEQTSGGIHMNRDDDIRIAQEFRKRQNRQILAVAIALFLVLLAGVVHKRPDIFGSFSSSVLFGVQAVFIAAFIGFTAMNWRCPVCRNHLGGDINRRLCSKCGTRLQ